MISTELFLDKMNLQMKSYYYGSISNGKYNDETGMAYIITYDLSGKIVTLYQGKFENGVLEDHTGNAWEISKIPDLDMKYIYYKGNFSDSHRDGKSTEENLTMERINEIIAGKSFNNGELNWYISEN